MLLVVIAIAAVTPAGWQVRLGLHWLIEHFLAFFTLTLVFCLAWKRPMAVAAILLPVAVLIETAQVLTPDRTADPVTALFAASGVASAALLADLVMTLTKRGALARPRQM
jgi:VanZ family protein